MFNAIRRLFFGRAHDAILPEADLPPLDLSPLPAHDPAETIPPASTIPVLQAEREDASFLVKSTAPAAPVAHPTDLAVVIRYVSADGEATERLVEIRKITVSSGVTHLRSYCYKRAAFRLFRLDRVQCAYDPQTGELFDLPGYVARLGGGSPIASTVQSRPTVRQAATAMGPAGKTPTECMLDQAADGMRVLLFLGRCDGDYHKSEHDVIVDYIRSACAIDDPDRDPATFDADEAETYLRRLRPNVRGFAGASSRLLARPNRAHFDLVADEAFRLIEADGAVRPEETRFYNELGRLLRAG